MNQTPQGNRTHIAFFGKTNAGKSSLINAITGQSIALVSDISGTTTDPVYKAMEILPLGPVMLIDTAGLNDATALGALREAKTLAVLDKTDCAVIVIDAADTALDFEHSLVAKIKEKGLPLIGILNKIDQLTAKNDSEISAYAEALSNAFDMPFIAVSAETGKGIERVKQQLSTHLPHDEDRFKIVGDLIHPGDFVVLVTPIDKAAPKGRLILPQQQTIRDILESDAMAIVTKEHELRETLASLGKKPSLVITDSQAFLKVSADTPLDIPMTSFSILFARHKGDLNRLVAGAAAIRKLQDGDRVLVAEGCTHHKQSDDIGTVKIPRWLRQLTGKAIEFDYSSGVSFTDDLKAYKLVVHCGGCMLNQRAMRHRINSASAYEVPIVNYGVLIAYVHGILDRALEPFPMARRTWDKLKEV
jgi:[FeFe] hydrogenase H-cluster maturation GTPase HydF